MTSASTFLVQIASVPGSQAGQRQFEQSRYLHELLVTTLTARDEGERPQIDALATLLPQHEIVLRSGFSQTAQWGLEPNMFLKVRRRWTLGFSSMHKHVVRRSTATRNRHE